MAPRACVFSHVVVPEYWLGQQALQPRASQATLLSQKVHMQTHSCPWSRVWVGMLVGPEFCLTRMGWHAGWGAGNGCRQGMAEMAQKHVLLVLGKLLPRSCGRHVVQDDLTAAAAAAAEGTFGLAT
eukprot:1159156-Pelagomonas_calceolata.AAC.6